MNTVRK